ncbi:MAG: hypothetical protein K2K40_08355 [Paramuribaculum sp.]|nr:hypothetical protein [Paramuribaculum sp.]
MRRLTLAAAIITASLAVSCGSGASVDDNATSPVPLPRAWPRTALYDSTYIPAVADIEVNASTIVTVSHDGHAVDAVYPAYHATLYVTDSRTATVGEADAAAANRIERMKLNAGGRQSEQTTLVTPVGYEALVLVTPVGSLSPAQFIARAPRRVVSGAVVLDRAPVSADSLAPTLDALRRDLLHLITALR